MSPSFLHNDYVLAFRWHYTRFQANDVVVVEHDSLGIIIKRIAVITDTGVELRGDNPASTSQERIGKQALNNILGKVIFKVSAKT